MLISTTIGLRYTKAKRDNRFVSFISLASIIGVALGVLELIVVLSVMNGYENGMRDRYLGMLSHVTVSDSDWDLPLWQDRRERVLETTQVTAVAPFVEKRVMLKEADKVKAVLLQAVLPEYEKSIGTINQFISSPKGLSILESGHYDIILGETLAKDLGVKVGESITLLSPRKESFIVNNDGSQSLQNKTPILRDFNIVSTFKIDMQMYDSGTAYIHMDDAQALFDTGDNVTGLRVQIDDIYKAKSVSHAIAKHLTGDYVVSNWTIQFANIFRAIQLQKTMLFLVLVLIVGVAAFNLVSTLIMVVTEKQSDIAILRTLGMSQGQVM